MPQSTRQRSTDPLPSQIITCIHGENDAWMCTPQDRSTLGTRHASWGLRWQRWWTLQRQLLFFQALHRWTLWLVLGLSLTMMTWLILISP
jgi:hypothetical protein